MIKGRYPWESDETNLLLQGPVPPGVRSAIQYNWVSLPPYEQSEDDFQARVVGWQAFSLVLAWMAHGEMQAHETPLTPKLERILWWPFTRSLQ